MPLNIDRWEARLRRWVEPEDSGGLKQPEGLFARIREFVGAVMRQPARPDLREQRRVRTSRTLPFDLYLALGQRSLRMFAAGKIDELSFYERRGVSAHHDTEYLTRLERGARGGEGYGAYGVIRLYQGGKRLHRIGGATGMWRRLDASYGVTALPDARSLALRPFSGFDPTQDDDDRAGRNRIAAPRAAKVFERAGMRRLDYADVLDIMRREMTAEQKIAWMEEAFSDRLRLGEIVQRYYLTAAKEVYMVRHHWGDGKLLFKAETSAEAQRLCAQSGAFRRGRVAA